MPGIILASLAIVLTICGAYDWYRYPFQINSTATSPTYGDTPSWLQIGKYVLLAAAEFPAVAIALRYWSTGRTSLTRREILVLMAASVFTARAAWAARISGSPSPQIVGPLVAVVPVAIATGAFARSISRQRIARIGWIAIVAIIVAHTAVDAFEIALWKINGRLPALAYTGASSKRWGGLWDDPNSASVFSALVLVYLLARREKWRRGTYAVAVCCIFVLVVAASANSIIALTMGGAVVLACRPGWAYRGIAGMLVALTIAVIAFSRELVVHAKGLPYLGTSLYEKSQSLSVRFRFSTYFPHPRTLGDWIIGSNAPFKTESGYGTWFVTTGITGLLLLILVVTASIWVQRRSQTFLWIFPVATGFLASSVVVPHLTIFPVASLFALMLLISAAYAERGLLPPRAQ